ncbi:hypothetical protein SAMN04488107_1111 [Geodermatophilus saharensis]|uniref:FHA domain protein n=1 Tax=Geodermatophilus saharensis TaxID=1137994 RepID=A0A239BFY7_9ACTN|nr:hypothetical protein [Geodermatophilus saharensis]SNS05993.1 hypothetical protein SAMN04488107_1111 [Geodermatophilus saharensis]
MSESTAAPPHAPTPAQPGDLTDHLVATDVWTDQMLSDAGIPVVDVPFVTVGGGVGSFVLVDYLRICGVPTDAIRVLTPLRTPWESYEYLTTVSQIPRGERLRSDSSGTPDNIWGFPGYAIREALQGNLRAAWNVLVEPVFADYYTPKAGMVFESMEKEMHRIRWPEMVVPGQVRMVRRRAGGGYFTVLTPPEGATPTRRIAYRSQFVHVAVGYPGLRFLPDLQRYRAEHNDYRRVVNAYEPHEHVYERLALRPGTVLVRGGGIVASRVLQRLIDDRDRRGLNTQIVHLFRSYVDKPHGPSVFMRRKGADGWAYQGFNWPKSTWGGQLRARMAELEGEDRVRIYKEMGGTNTPMRQDWQEQLARGRQQGWYRVVIGQIDGMRPVGDLVEVSVDTDQGRHVGTFDHVVDCTGLEADIREHRLLADLLDHSNAQRNPLGRLDVEADFEVTGTRNGGKVYASGSATLGGYFAGVDSFLGLLVAAQEITDDLAAQGFARKLSPGRSTSQWWKWVRNTTI